MRLVHDGKPVDVGGPRQQSVLAVLALSAGHRVSTDRLVDLVWDESPPPSARRTVQSYVSSLRSAFRAAGVVEPSQNGYTLNLNRSDIDLLAFEDKAVELLTAPVIDPDDRAQGLADVLSTWETPLDGLQRSSRLGELTAPFEELRFQVIEGLAAAQIAGTRSGDAVKMLQALVREYPTRENLWLALARGLNRLGRRDAALNVIQRAREALREHLGIHPSALLSAFEADLLSDDAAPGARSAGDSWNDWAPLDSGGHAATLELAGRPGNLPRPLSSFIGRADEIGQLVKFFMGSRLVTLRGLGGIGKTSLAIRAAAYQAAEFDDGVWFIDLAYIARGTAMSERFMAGLRLRSRSAATPLDQLLSQLAPLRALLVVDNCELQLAEIAELVGQILQTAPDVHILATGRRSLSLAGEAVWQVEPLEASSATELFAARAKLARYDFELSDANRGVVELICQKLDGIPLAIELAAARLNVLSLNQILEHLGDRFGLLGDRASERRDSARPLQSALDWSYELLNERDRKLLQHLVVFPAPFTLEAAKAICGQSNSDADLVNSMTQLVEASLVNFDAKEPDPRYRLLETVREYTVEKLSARERNEVGLRHANHFADVASRIAAQHKTDHIGAIAAGDRDLDNFRTAIEFAFAHGEHQLGLSIAGHLRVYFFSRAANREFLRWLEDGLAHIDPASDVALLALANALVTASNLQDTEVAERLAERVQSSIDLARSPAIRARLLSSYAAHLMNIDPRAADEVLATATGLVKRINTIETISCIHNRALIAWTTGDLPHVVSMIAVLDDLPDEPLVRRERLLVEIQSAACAGNWENVIDASLESDDLDEGTLAEVLHFRAEALGALGRIDEAIATLDQLDELEQREDLAQTGSHIIRATTELRRGDAATARSLMAESAASFRRDADRIQWMWIASLAGVAAHQLGEHETAARHFGHARAIAIEFDINMRTSERHVIDEATQQCRAVLGPDRYDQLADQGSSFNWKNLAELLHTI